MGEAPSILQIVGYQNSGKTTLVEKIVHALAEIEMKVATIKHHGHGGFPEVAQKIAKDTVKPGAVVSSVEGLWITFTFFTKKEMVLARNYSLI